MLGCVCLFSESCERRGAAGWGGGVRRRQFAGECALTRVDKPWSCCLLPPLLLPSAGNGDQWFGSKSVSVNSGRPHSQPTSRAGALWVKAPSLSHRRPFTSLPSLPMPSLSRPAVPMQTSIVIIAWSPLAFTTYEQSHLIVAPKPSFS